MWKKKLKKNVKKNGEKKNCQDKKKKWLDFYRIMTIMYKIIYNKML